MVHSKTLDLLQIFLEIKEPMLLIAKSAIHVHGILVDIANRTGKTQTLIRIRRVSPEPTLL